SAPMTPVFKNTGLYCLGSSPDYIILNPSCKQKDAEFRWFDAPECTGTPVHVGDSLPLDGTPGYHIYYVYQIKDGCKSRTVEAFVFISRPPTIVDIKSMDPSSCELADGSITIVATGDTTLYYSIAVPPVYTTSDDFFGLKNGRYPVAVRDEAGCEIIRDTIKLLAFNTPEAPIMISRDTIYCKEEARLALEAHPNEDGPIYWYKDLVLKNSIGRGEKLPINNYGGGNYIFSAVELVDGCYSDAADVRVKILGDLDLGLKDTVACLGATIRLMPKNVPEGATFLWMPGYYTTPNIDVVVGKNPQVYTLTVTDPAYDKNCQTTVSVKVSGTSVPERVDMNGCVGDTVEMGVADATALVWKDGTVGNPRKVAAQLGLKQYYAEVELENGCKREYIFNVTGKKIDSVTINVKPLFDTVYCSPAKNSNEYRLEAQLNNTSLPLDLQWYMNGEAVENATGRILNISNLEPGDYEFVVTASARTICIEPSLAVSPTYKLTAHPRPKVYAGADQPKQPYQETTCIGCDATVEGGTPFTGEGEKPYIYNWKGNYIPSTVASGKPLQFMTSRMGTTTVYTLTAIDAVGCAASDDIKVTVVGGPFKATISSNRDTVCFGDTARISALVSGGSGNYQFFYEVISRPSTATAADIAHLSVPDANDSSIFAASPLCVTTKAEPVVYRMTVVNLTSGTPTSADTLRLTRNLWVHAIPQVGEVSVSDSTLCADSAATMLLSHYKGTRAYWQYTTNGIDWTTFAKTADLPQASKVTLPGANYGTHRYVRAQVANGVCDFQPTDSISVRTYANLNNVISATGQTLCPEVEDVDIEGYAMTEGGNGTFAYLWQEKKNNTFVNAAGNNSDTSYTIAGEIGATRQFRRLVFSDGCTYTSNVQTINVYSNSLITPIEGETHVCFDSVSTYEVSNKTMDTYQWQSTADTTDGGVWTDLPAITYSYTTNPVKDTLYYRVIGQANGCRPDTTPVFAVYPTEPLEPRIYISIDTMESCIG
ncbi:MAG: hypothetical protein K2I68_01545, partial [Bacteroidales bacterium]|nr:hypothetical protein [Bacteroidales bacterium]